LKLLNTEKLFYDKYMLRASMYFTMAPIFREKKFNHTRDVLDDLQHQFEQGSEELIWNKGYRYSRPITVDEFQDTLNLYNYLTSQDYNSYSLRVEQMNLNWYSNDEGQLDQLIYRFKKRIVSISKPTESQKNLLEPNIILKPSKYEFKVTVGATVDPNVAYWFEKNSDKVKIGSTFLECIKQGQYVKGFYFYVKNEKVLNLVKIVLGGEITRIDKFVNNVQS
tara:strand:- start:9891 stop:10556 length:666 start_codon:yes stop_codon:yes gene_type:complete